MYRLLKVLAYVVICLVTPTLIGLISFFFYFGPTERMKEVVVSAMDTSEPFQGNDTIIVPARERRRTKCDKSPWADIIPPRYEVVRYILNANREVTWVTRSIDNPKVFMVWDKMKDKCSFVGIPFIENNNN